MISFLFNDENQSYHNTKALPVTIFNQFWSMLEFCAQCQTCISHHPNKFYAKKQDKHYCFIIVIVVVILELNTHNEIHINFMYVYIILVQPSAEITAIICCCCWFLFLFHRVFDERITSIWNFYFKQKYVRRNLDHGQNIQIAN